MRKRDRLWKKLWVLALCVVMAMEPAAVYAEEPAEASCIAEGDAENVLKHAIRAVSFRNRSGFIGNVGNFRWCNSWAGIIQNGE